MRDLLLIAGEFLCILDGDVKGDVTHVGGSDHGCSSDNPDAQSDGSLSAYLPKRPRTAQ